MFYQKMIVILGGLGSFALLLGLVYLLFALPTPSYTPKNATTFIPVTVMKNTLKAVNTIEPNESAVIAKWYAPVSLLSLGEVTVRASVADTETEREQGLSGTPYLPIGIVKLFIFDTAAPYAFWMKDMNYPIDIIWLDETKTVIHIASSLTPESYPETFAPPTPARYVIEAPAGFAASNHIAVGTQGKWNDQLQGE